MRGGAYYLADDPVFRVPKVLEPAPQRAVIGWVV
jgi:hypothetical protein